MQARGVPFDILVLPGLVEQGFPKVPRQDPLLLDEEAASSTSATRARPRCPKKPRDGWKKNSFSFSRCEAPKKPLFLPLPISTPARARPGCPPAISYETLQAVTGRRQTHWDEDSPYLRKVAVSDWVRGGDDARVDDLEEVLSRFQEARRGQSPARPSLCGRQTLFHRGPAVS